jgi:TRAP-type C4-dicarboxylate transport system permease small subunit
VPGISSDAEREFCDMAAIEKVLIACEQVLVWIAVVAMTTLMLLTTADATMRYLFDAPIAGAYEISEKYLITSGVFLAFSYAYRGDVFIRVSFFIEKMPAAVKLACDHAAQILTLLYCIVCAYATLGEAINGMWDGSTLSALPTIPLAPSYFLVPVGYAVMAVLVLVDVPKVAKGGSRLIPPSIMGDASQSAS